MMLRSWSIRQQQHAFAQRTGAVNIMIDIECSLFCHHHSAKSSWHRRHVMHDITRKV